LSDPVRPDLMQPAHGTVDDQAFRELIAPHLASLRRLLYVLLNGNRHDMEDVEQEVLLELCRNLRGFRLECPLRTWVLRLGRNKAVDEIRKRTAGARTLRRAWTAEIPQDPVAVVLQKEQSALLWKAFERLAPSERELLLLKDAEGISIEDVARVTGLPQGTIKSRLHRARRKLFRLLGPEGGQA
jgi:RNA polymerase sigma-70 factor (ECF subfamily)